MARTNLTQSQVAGSTLGYAQITTSFATSSTTMTQVTGLSTTVTIPSGGRRVKITAFCGEVSVSVSPSDAFISIWDGTVGSGTQLALSHSVSAAANYPYSHTAMAVVTPSAGSKTYNVGFRVNIGTGTITLASAAPAFILVELI